MTRITTKKDRDLAKHYLSRPSESGIKSPFSGTPPVPQRVCAVCGATEPKSFWTRAGGKAYCEHECWEKREL